MALPLHRWPGPPPLRMWASSIPCKDSYQCSTPFSALNRKRLSTYCGVWYVHCSNKQGNPTKCRQPLNSVRPVVYIDYSTSPQDFLCFHILQFCASTFYRGGVPAIFDGRKYLAGIIHSHVSYTPPTVSPRVLPRKCLPFSTRDSKEVRHFCQSVSVTDRGNSKVRIATLLVFYCTTVVNPRVWDDSTGCTFCWFWKPVMWVKQVSSSVDKVGSSSEELHRTRYSLLDISDTVAWALRFNKRLSNVLLWSGNQTREPFASNE